MKKITKKGIIMVIVIFLLFFIIKCLPVEGAEDITTIEDITIPLTESEVVEQKSEIEEPAISILSTDNQEEEIQELSIYKDLVDNLSEREKYLIYQITYAEAGNQEIEGQRAVIEVILNRVLSDRFPNTVEEVLCQSGQFVTWKLRNSVEHNETQETALELVGNEESILSSDYVFFSLGKFSWAKNYIKIQDHWFGTY